MTSTPDRSLPAPDSRSVGRERTTPAAPFEGDGASGQTPATAAARGAAVAGQTRAAPAPSDPVTVPSLHAGAARPKKRRPKDIGTDAERAVQRWLKVNGFPHVERRALRGTADAGDLTGTQGICWEIKARNRPVSDAQVAAWMAETETERANAGADVGVLVIRRPAFGAARAGSWWALMPYITVLDLRTGDDWHCQPDTWTGVDQIPMRMLLADAVALLRAAGFGTPYGQVTP